MAEELKPCPFCGGKPTVWQIEGVGGWRVGCAHEDCQIYRVTTIHRSTKAEAITAWNTRTNPWTLIVKGDEGTLPKNDKQVWISYQKSGYTYNAYYDTIYKTWNIFNYGGGFVRVEPKDLPTHWMQIPPTPKPEQVEGKEE